MTVARFSRPGPSNGWRDGVLPAIIAGLSGLRGRLSAPAHLSELQPPPATGPRPRRRGAALPAWPSAGG
jgi:hypothetical protein